LADQKADIAFGLAAHRALGATLVYMGNHAEAVRHLEKVLAIPVTADLRFALYRYEVTDPWISAQSLLSRPLWLLGYVQRAVDQNKQALTMAAGLDHPLSLAHALGYAACLHQFDQDRARASAAAEQALALSTEKGFLFWTDWSKIMYGWTLAEPGQSERAVIEIRQGLEDWRAQGAELGRTYFLTLLAEAFACAGRLEEGLIALAESQEFAEATAERFWQAEIHRLQGELLLAFDPNKAQDAAACFHQALEVARRQQARSLELRAAMSLGRLWHHQGKTAAARELLAPVYGTFTEGFQTHDLQAARALLEQWH
jgi:predicted ATPase